MISTLIVEDDPMVTELNKQYLSQLDGFFLVGTSSNVLEAIKVIEKSKIDLVLLDSYMPDKNGFDLLMYIRQQKLDIDVIFITAARDINSVNRAMKYGAIDYLIKPFTYERFNESLTSYKSRISFIKKKKLVNQKDVDNIILSKEDPVIDMKDLPKGVTKKTLKLIWNEIESTKEKIFSIEDISTRVGLSRVSIRKYLHFLEDIGLLQVKVEYGYIGRPVTKYQFIDLDKDIIKRYL